MEHLGTGGGVEGRNRALDTSRDRLDGCIWCGCLSPSVCKLANPGDVAGAACPGPCYAVGG